MSKRVFVTGAAGFIGSHLAKFLQARGDHVLGFDNFNDYYPSKLKRDRSEELKRVGIEVVEGDICDFTTLFETAKHHKATHVVHLAAQAGVRYSLINPQAYLQSNINGFFNILEVCRQIEGVKLTYASSSSVYGLNSQIPYSVNDRTDAQASLYGVTKKANELMAVNYHHLYKIPVTGLRFFTVYGPWGRPDMAYYSFTKAILEGKTIEIFNEGKMMRDFTYIDDIIEGAVAALDLEAACEVFNLGNHKPVELGRFIEILENVLKKKAKKMFLPMQPGDVVNTYADIDHSSQRLGFYPKVALDAGIPRFVEWYLQYAQTI